MARVRNFEETPAAAAAQPTPASGMGDWPFAGGADNAKVPPPKAPATEKPAEPAPAAEPPKAAAPKPAATPVAAKPVVAKPSDAVEALVIEDLMSSVATFSEADKKHRAVALEAIETRIKIVKAVLGI